MRKYRIYILITVIAAGLAVQAVLMSPAGAANVYPSSGIVTSANLLAGSSALSINNFYYNITSLPPTSGVTVQFSTDGSNWYSAAGVLTASTTLSTTGGANLSLVSLGWSGTAFYYRFNLYATSDLSGTPAIKGIRLDYTPTSGYENAFVFNNQGQMGLGETSPGSTLSVKGGVSIGETTDYSQAAAPTGGLIVKGKVGIGTTSPAAMLSLNANGVVDPFDVYSTTTSNSVFHITYQGNVQIGTSTAGSRLVIQGSTSDNTAAAITMYNSSGTLLATMLNNGKFGIGTSSPVASLDVYGTAGADPFNVSSSSNVSLFHITASGNTGIGTTTPLARLDVYGLAGNNNIVNFASSSNISQFLIGPNGSTTIATLNNALPVRSTAGGQLFNGAIALGSSDVSGVLGTGNGGTGTTTGFTSGSVIFSNGSSLAQNNANFFWDNTNNRLGIGTNTPSGLLDVFGSSATTTLTTFIGSRSLSIVNTDQTNNNAAGLAFRTLDANGLLTTAAKFDAVYTSHTANQVSGDMVLLTNNAGIISEKMRVMSTGNVGIGSTSPTALLTLQGTSGSATDLLNIASSTNTSVFIVKSSGNVGIGTTSPAGRLDVQGGSLFVNPENAAGSPVYNNLGIRITNNGGNSRGNLTFFTGSNDATVAFADLLSASARLAQITYSNQSDGHQLLFASQLSDGYLSFDTGASVAERMRITSGGNVGIGTTAPGAKLHLASTNAADTPIGDIVMSRYWNGASDTRGSAIFHLKTSASGTDMLVFGVSGDANNGVAGYNAPNQLSQAKMVIQANGNVGIGTTTVPQKLTVAGGNVLISNGWLCVGNGSSTPANGACASASTTAAGTIYANNLSIVQGDYAERYPSLDNGILPGMLVAMDGQNSNDVVRATGTSTAIGAVSTAPGIVIGDTNANASSTTYAIALSGRVPVKVTNENGNIKIGDYITVSAQFNGYGAKAAQAGQVVGRALENFTSSVTNDSGTILVFIQPTYWQPKVSDLVQNAPNSGDSGVQAWLSGLANLNMTNASVFGDIAVTGSVAIQNDLHVGGIIYAATLNVDTINAKKLCLDDVCITKVELQKLLQMETAQPDSGQVAGVSSPTPATIVNPSASDPTITNPAPAVTDPAAPSTPTVPVVTNTPTDTSAATTPAPTGDGTPLQQPGNLGSGAADSAPASTVSDAATPPVATGN